MPGRGWFLGVHVFTHYLKLAFFRGTELDEAQLAAWIRQAAELPAWDGK